LEKEISERQLALEKEISERQLALENEISERQLALEKERSERVQSKVIVYAFGILFLLGVAPDSVLGKFGQALLARVMRV
jgi:hypothetical protein